MRPFPIEDGEVLGTRAFHSVDGPTLDNCGVDEVQSAIQSSGADDVEEMEDVITDVVKYAGFLLG